MTTTIDDLDRLADRAARYARYARSAGGLSSVIGGVLLVASFTANAFAELTPATRALLAATPLLWLAAKELLRRRYYQRPGEMLPAPTPKELRQHRWAVVYLAVIALIVLGVFVRAWIGAGRPPEGQMFGYILVVLALPLAAWRWFWSVSDFLVGVLLFCQSAVVIGGGHYPAIWLAYVAACAGIAIAYGWREHRDYLGLRAELQGDADDPVETL